MLTEVVIILISITFSAFFSGMEIAYITSNRLYFELEKKQGSWSSSIISKLNKQPSRFITTMLIGNNIALVIYGVFMGDLIISVLFPEYINANDFPTYILLIQTIISTLIILVTAEFIPKVIFRIYSNELLNTFSIPAYLIYQIFYFISGFTVYLSKLLLRIFTGEKLKEEAIEFRRVDIGNYIAEQLDLADNNKEMDVEIQMFQNALDFNGVKARECMVPRTDIIGIDISESIETLRKLFVTTGKSKIIVYKNNIDDVVGYVHSFEMFKKPKNVKSILLPVEFVPETLQVNDLLSSLIKKKKTIAVVIDEYGGTSGLLTIEDIIEELLGEIEDEHEVTAMKEEKINNKEFIFSSKLEIDYINEKYLLDIEENDEYETLGGLVLFHLQSIPEKNQIIKIENIEIKVIKVANNRIDEVRVKITS